MNATESRCSRCRKMFMYYAHINVYNVCDECMKILYYELRGTLDHESMDTTIIVSLTGDFYTKIGDHEFKL